ncbi:hypothetical protein ABW19_dt0207777 [Dactylella cylindrospora]|nr:hypothetical protein ABW19_dt0207777 [Dactylella cylindrospora]
MEDILISAGIKLGTKAIKAFTGGGSKPGAGSVIGALAGAALGEDVDFEGGEDFEIEDGGGEEAGEEEYDATADTGAEEYTGEEVYQEEVAYDDTGAYAQEGATEEYYTEDATGYGAYGGEATAYDQTYYDETAVEGTYTDEYGVAYDASGNVVDDGSGYTYEYTTGEATTYGEYAFDGTDQEATGQYDDPTSTGQDATGQTEVQPVIAGSAFGKGAAVGGVALAGAAVAGGAALAARRGRGRGKGIPAGRGHVVPLLQRGRGTPIGRARGALMHPRGGLPQQAVGTTGGMRLPPSKHSTPAHNAVVRGAPFRGRGGPMRGGARGGMGPHHVGHNGATTTVTVRGRGSARARGVARGGRQSHEDNRKTSTGPIGVNNNPAQVINTSQPVIPIPTQPVVPIPTQPVIPISTQPASGIPTTVGPMPGTVQQAQFYNGINPMPPTMGIGYMGQANGIQDPNMGMGSPPPSYASVIYNNPGAPAPTQRRAMDPSTLQQMKTRKLEALQRVQQKEKDRIEAKRKEEERDRERARSGAHNFEESQEPKVQINLPPGVQAAGPPTVPQKDERPPAGKDPRLANVFPTQSPQSSLGRSDSSVAPQVVPQVAPRVTENPNPTSHAPNPITYTPSPLSPPNQTSYEMDGNGFTKPAARMDAPTPTSYNQQAPEPILYNQSAPRPQPVPVQNQNRMPPPNRWSISGPSPNPVELGSDSMRQQPPVPGPVHSNTWTSAPQPVNPQESQNQQASGGTQRPLSMLQRFPSRKPIQAQRPVSMMARPSQSQTGFGAAGFNQPSRDPRFSYQQSGQQSYPPEPTEIYSQNVVPSPPLEEEEEGWKPPPLRAVQRRRFHSGDPNPPVEPPEARGPRELASTPPKKLASPPPANNAFEPPPPPPPLPPPTLDQAPVAVKVDRPEPEPERRGSYFENMSPDIEIPGLRIRKSPTASSNSSTTTNYVAYHNPSPPFQNQSSGRPGTQANQTGYQAYHSVGNPVTASSASSPTYTYSTPAYSQGQDTGNSTNYRAEGSAYSPYREAQSPVAQFQNQQFAVAQPPSHIMEMPASTGWAHTSNDKSSPYNMNPMIAELPEIPAPPIVRKQEIEPQTSAPVMSANSVTFGWESYYS